MAIHGKIKKARQELGLKQTDFASLLGIHQRDVSKMENGTKKFIPNAYISFLQEHGYDLNSLFDDNAPLSKLSSIGKLLEEPSAPYELAVSKNIKNKILAYFGIDDFKQLTELFEHYDENTPTLNRPMESAIVSVWEKKYLPEFNDMKKRLDDIDSGTSKPT